MKWWHAPAGQITGWQPQPDFFFQATYPCIQGYQSPWEQWATMVWRGQIGYHYRQTDNAGQSWRAVGQLSEHGTGGDSLYYDYAQGADGSNHYCGCWVDKNNTRGVPGGILERLHDFFYYDSPATGGYRKSDGTALPSPFILSPSNYGSTVRVLDTGTEGAQVPLMELDSNSKPHILQTRGNGTNCRVEYGRLVNGSWQWQTITDCDDIADCGALKILSDRVVALIIRGGTSGSSTVTNARRGGNLERWERLESTGQWVSQGTILTAEPPLYWHQPVAVVGADAFIVGQCYDWPLWDASDKSWCGGRIELIDVSSAPPPPVDPPPAETWHRSGPMGNTPGGFPMRAVNGVVESTDPAWQN